MDLREAKLILEKINRLFESMSLDERKIDTFERDLMLSYTKQFYDSFKYEDENSTPQPIRRKAPPAIVTEKATAAPPPAPVTKITPPPVEPEEEVSIPVPTFSDKPASVPSEKIAVAAAPVVTKREPSPAPAPIIKKKPTKLAPEMEDLFAFNSTKELSDKLSQQPIADLTKAVGINEKILTINELFGKDSVFFAEIMKKMNKLGSFDDAKLILVQLAEKFDWLAPSRKKKAIVFIKLVRRRYL